MILKTKDHYIAFFRQNGFNAFPIPQHQKVADKRYDASRTSPNQIILPNENYGIIPIVGAGTAIVDFDDKVRYRRFAQDMIAHGSMVIESPHGWHLPVKGLSGQIQKTELHDYAVQEEKIIEIQGDKHYCVGAESEVLDPETKLIVKYINRGTDKIFDAKGSDFHFFVDKICVECKVATKKKDNRMWYLRLRERFLKGEIPLKGTSNDYFHQAALQCNTNGLSKEDAVAKIESVYHKWSIDDSFSGRPWNNILNKIEEVYANDQKVHEGRPKKDKIDKPSIALKLLKSRKLYSNVQTHEVFENQSGFLELINHSLKKELYIDYPELTKEDNNDILFKLESGASPMPETNRQLIVFKNGVYDIKNRKIIESNEIADMGFKNYNYLENTTENFPTEFHKIMYDNVPKEQHKRINAGLKAIFSNQLDPKISIIHGMSGVGKSTPLTILVNLLGDYAMTVELKQFLADKFISAKIFGKHLLVFQDLPKEWKDFTVLKTVTGEQRKTERGFMQDSITFENKVKIWASGNYLAIIPDEEKDAMYTRRLSLINNVKTEAYKEDPTLTKRIVETEGEKIISWIINLQEDECEYESRDVLSKEWERIASPEIIYLEQHWQLSDEENDTSVMRLVNDCRDKTHVNVSIQQMLRSLKVMGYVVRNNIIKNITMKETRQRLPPRGLDE